MLTKTSLQIVTDVTRAPRLSELRADSSSPCQPRFPDINKNVAPCIIFTEQLLESSACAVILPVTSSSSDVMLHYNCSCVGACLGGLAVPQACVANLSRIGFSSSKTTLFLRDLHMPVRLSRDVLFDFHVLVGINPYSQNGEIHVKTRVMKGAPIQGPVLERISGST